MGSVRGSRTGSSIDPRARMLESQMLAAVPNPLNPSQEPASGPCASRTPCHSTPRPRACSSPPAPA
eukprot:213452-Chlamydomonas_euryale.AAC.11